MATYFPTMPKLVDANRSIVADFISELAVNDGEALTAIETSCEVASGTDPTPSAVLVGSPVLAQNTGTQVVGGGLPGVIYRIGFNGTTNQFNEIVMYTYMAVLSADPYEGS